MTLPLESAGVSDQYVRRALDLIAQQFPIAPPNLLGGIPTTTATLPTGTYSGQDFYYQVSGGGVWHFKYNLTSGKWDFSGGPPLFAEVATSESTVSTTYAALATAGPSIALPFAGDYDVEIGSGMYNTAGSDSLMSYDIGGTGAVDADSIKATEGAGVRTWAASRVRRKTGLTAVTLTAKYKATANTSNFYSRWMRVLPVRVG